MWVEEGVLTLWEEGPELARCTTSVRAPISCPTIHGIAVELVERDGEVVAVKTAFGASGRLVPIPRKPLGRDVRGTSTYWEMVHVQEYSKFSWEVTLSG